MINSVIILHEDTYLMPSIMFKQKKAPCVISLKHLNAAASALLVARMHKISCVEGWLMAGYDCQNSCVYNPLSVKSYKHTVSYSQQWNIRRYKGNS